MKCNCGGELKRIKVDCYQCTKCGLKQAVAFAALPMPDLTPDLTPKMIPVISHTYIKSSLEEIEKSILIAFGVPSKLLNK